MTDRFLCHLLQFGGQLKRAKKIRARKNALNSVVFTLCVGVQKNTSKEKLTGFLLRSTLYVESKDEIKAVQKVVAFAQWAF